MTTTPGAPDAAAVHAAIVATTVRRSGNRLLLLASEAVVLCSALWLLVLVAPYVTAPGDVDVALFDQGPMRTSEVAPRIVGIAVAALAAALALALRRWRAALWCTAGSTLVALAAYSAWWASGIRTGSDLPLRIGWYGDVALSGLTVAAAVVGTVGVRRSLAGRPRRLDRRLLRSTPFVAAGMAIVAITSGWLLSRDPLFPTAFAIGATGVTTDDAPVAMRVAGLVSAVLIVVLPVLAAVAPERRIGVGLVLGWVGAVAVPATRVLGFATAPIEREPDPSFVVALILVGLGSIALLVWLALTGRTPLVPAPPTEAERRAHQPPDA